MDLNGAYQGLGGVGGLLAVVDKTDPQDIKTYIPCIDGKGTVHAYADASNGKLVAEFEYDPWGRVISEKVHDDHADFFRRGATFRFQTKMFDSETGLYYYGFRYYDPSTCRWISADPLGESGGLNLYAFCDGDPINHVDYLGAVKRSEYMNMIEVYKKMGPLAIAETKAQIRATRIANGLPAVGYSSKLLKVRMFFDNAISSLETYVARKDAQRIAFNKAAANDFTTSNIPKDWDDEVIRNWEYGTNGSITHDTLPRQIVRDLYYDGLFTVFSMGGYQIVSGSKWCRRAGIWGYRTWKWIWHGRERAKRLALLRQARVTKRLLGTRGIRNAAMLTSAQEAQVLYHAKELGLDLADIQISKIQSYYSENWRYLAIGPDAFPAPASMRQGGTVLERLTPKSVVAHEAGHMITTRAGKGFPAGSLLDEVQASLVGRNLQSLSKVERYQLLRDAVERAKDAGEELRKLLPQLKGLLNE